MRPKWMSANDEHYYRRWLERYEAAGATGLRHAITNRLDVDDGTVSGGTAANLASKGLVRRDGPRSWITAAGLAVVQQLRGDD